MKKIGIILLAFAALNLLVAIIASANGETYAAGSKFSGALLLGAIGGLLFYFGGKKEASNQESTNRSSTLRYASVQDENFWQRYKRLNPTEASAIESVTERTMSLQSEKDAQEIVASMERWAKNIGCQINDIKTEFLQSYKSVFDNADTKEILEHLKNVKLREEANRFNISMQNTCTHFMIKWLTEVLRKESPQPANNQIKTRNKMSARDLVKSENASLQFMENPNTGKIFFVCGSKKGYVSPAAVEKMETGSLDDFCYAEVSIGSSDYVPCLLVKNGNKVVREFSNEETKLQESSSIEKKVRIKLKDAFNDAIQDVKNNAEYQQMQVPFKELVLKRAIENLYTALRSNKAIIAMCNLYKLNHNDLLDDEYAKAQEIIKESLIKEIQNEEKNDDDLPF